MKQYFIDRHTTIDGEILSTVYTRDGSAKFVSTYGPYSSEMVAERAQLAEIIHRLNRGGYERMASIFDMPDEWMDRKERAEQAIADLYDEEV